MPEDATPGRRPLCCGPTRRLEAAGEGEAGRSGRELRSESERATLGRLAGEPEVEAGGDGEAAGGGGDAGVDALAVGGRVEVVLLGVVGFARGVVVGAAGVELEDEGGAEGERADGP